MCQTNQEKWIKSKENGSWVKSSENIWETKLNKTAKIMCQINQGNKKNQKEKLKK